MIHLDLITSGQTNSSVSSRAVLVIHEDGQIRCLSEDLSKEYWNSGSKDTPLQHDPLEKIHVVCAATLSIGQAERSLLKGREDILARQTATLDPNTSSSSYSNILVLISRNVQIKNSRNKGSLSMRIIDLSRSESLLGSFKIAGYSMSTEELLHSLIPEPHGVSGDKLMYSLNVGNGILYQYGGNDLVIYDLTGSTPRIEQHIKLDSQVSSCLYIGPSAAALTSSCTITVLDTRYQSIHSSQPLAGNVAQSNGVKDANKGRLDTPIKTRLLSFFSTLDLVVGLQGQRLVTFQLNSQDLRTRKRKRGGTLVNAIGRGINHSKPDACAAKIVNGIPKTRGESLPLYQETEDWHEKMSKLDSYVAIGEVERFDKLMTSETGTNLNRQGQNFVDISTEHEGVTKFKQFAFSFDRQKITYVLNKIFCFDRPWDSSYTDDGNKPPILKVRFLPQSTFQWLSTNGFVSLEQVESALKQAEAMPASATLGLGSMIQAFAAFDDSLQTLLYLLKGPIHLAPQEIVSALRLSIEKYQRLEDGKGVGMITDGQSEAEKHINNTSQTVNEATEPSITSSNLISGTVEPQALVKACIDRFNRYHSSAIVKSFKHHLPRNDLISLITYLRIDLARSGWLSRYMDDYPHYNSPFPNSGTQISITAKILNCAIDALGTAGWILGGSASSGSDILVNENRDTVSYMKAEISAILEGIEESAYLQGVLGEALLFCKSAKGRSAGQEDVVQQPKKIKPVTMPLKDNLASALPLGMKAPPRVSLTKIGAGGELQMRSARDVGRLKSRMVSKYSFERIRV